MESTALIGSLAALVWHGSKYGFKVADMQWESQNDPRGENWHINNWNMTRYFYCTYWVPRGIYMLDREGVDKPEDNCVLSGYSGVFWYASYFHPILSSKKTLVPEPYWEFLQRNVYLWKHHRYYNTGASVVLPFLTRYGRFRYETNAHPPFPRDIGHKAARPLWFRYYKEKLLQRAIVIEDAFEMCPTDYPEVVEPGMVVAGWDEEKSVVAVFTATGEIAVGGPTGGYVIPPGLSWVAPDRIGYYHGWLYPPVSFTNSPPALYFPTRAEVKEGEELKIVADGSWDKEGDKITWEIEESPFQVVERGVRHFTILADRPEGNYVIWIRYSDGHHTIHHPIVVHVFPTFYFGGEK